MRAFLRLVVPVCLFWAGAGISASAFGVGYYKQDGRVTASNKVEGTVVTIKGHAFHPRDGSCYIFGNVLEDFTSLRQVEVGLVRCKNAVLGGTCHDLHAFAEHYTGITYLCNQGSAFALDTGYNSVISRNSGTTIGGAMHGATVSQSGFATTDKVKAWAWGEATGAVNGCPNGAILGYFTDWNKQNVGGGWSLVTSAATVRHGGNIVANCAAVSAISGGDFHVSH